MGKWWSLVFGLVMLACGLSFVVAPFVGWWMPKGYSTHAKLVDDLFDIILYITGFFFFLTEGLLVYFLYVYAARPVAHTADARLPAPLKVAAGFVKLIPSWLHHEHRVEMAWTIVPALILLYIAFAQVNTWANIKYESRAPQYEGEKVPLQVSVSARQFEWRLRYPDTQRLEQWLTKKSPKNDYESFARHPHYDDLHAVNELHVVKDHPVVIHLSTRDVIHSFNIPMFRVKQDALPGREIPVWFTPTKANTVRGQDGRWLHGVDPSGTADATLNWDLPCAELCGWGHYRMIAKVYVHDTPADLQSWLASVKEQQVLPQGEQNK